MPERKHSRGRASKANTASRRSVRTDEPKAPQPTEEQTARERLAGLRGQLAAIVTEAREAQEALLDAPNELLALLAAGDNAELRLRALTRLAKTLDVAVAANDDALTLARSALEVVGHG